MSRPNPLVSISVVSHGQSHLVSQLLADLDRLPWRDFEVIATVNLPEDDAIYEGRGFPVKVIRNAQPKGFGANHNAAFAHARAPYFAVVNPDIRLPDLDIEQLLEPLADPAVGAVAPVVLSSAGTVEDSARRFPSVARLMRRVLLGQRAPDYAWKRDPIEVDWVAGMFVLFRGEVFRALGGFDDQRFFMYFEDVDLCHRLWRSGRRVLLQPRASVIHDARRASHRQLRHLRWHMVSAARYLGGF